ncbi:chymotrypsinogen 2-like protein [Dinothrombium tinctorium]|uniref:Chymotrypsinogen 2-like protein n=1 Tax=Dinothrombium tinctorium TaxID=1965070 RepID=A0A3S3S4V7_9ACAR|nr:chymotrypsinogen 2-like protein [Dinothrombium tinctorium]
MACGRPNTKTSFNKPNAFIIGGRLALPGEVPWQVRLSIRTNRFLTSSTSFCGGFIWNENTIVTAAHCVQDCSSLLPNLPFLSSKSIEVCMGDLKRSDNSDGQICEETKTFKSHPYYSCSTHKNDIAIIRVPKMQIPKFTSNGYGSINSLCHPSQSQYSGSVIASGWGKYSRTSSETSDDLRIANMVLKPTLECQKAYGFLQMGSSQLCVQGVSGETSCGGDSGGPLFKYVNGRAEALGITSYGTVGCPENGLVVFTSVPAFREWLNQNAY